MNQKYMDNFGLYLKTNNFVDYLELDTLMGRICRKCYTHKIWDKFKKNDNKYLDICMECELVNMTLENIPKNIGNCITQNKVEYILYLHPSRKTFLYEYLQTYWIKSNHYTKNAKITNTCINYPFHITLPQFYNIKLGDKNIVIFNEIINECIKIYNYLHPKDDSNSIFLNYTHSNKKYETIFRGLITYNKKILSFINILGEKFYGEKYKKQTEESFHLSLYNHVDKNYTIVFDKLLEGLSHLIEIHDFTIILWKNTTNNLSEKHWKIINEWDFSV